MNKRRVIIQVLGWSIVCFFLFKLIERQAITSVLNQRANFKHDFYAKLGWQGYVLYLKNINIQFCPMKFQLAWLGYIHACELHGQKSSQVVFPLAKKMKKLMPASRVSMGIDYEDYRVQRAVKNLMRIAWEYGVSFIPSRQGLIERHTRYTSSIMTKDHKRIILNSYSSDQVVYVK